MRHMDPVLLGQPTRAKTRRRRKAARIEADQRNIQNAAV